MIQEKPMYKIARIFISNQTNCKQKQNSTTHFPNSSIYLSLLINNNNRNYSLKHSTYSFEASNLGMETRNFLVEVCVQGINPELNFVRSAHWPRAETFPVEQSTMKTTEMAITVNWIIIIIIIILREGLGTLICKGLPLNANKLRDPLINQKKINK